MRFITPKYGLKYQTHLLANLYFSWDLCTTCMTKPPKGKYSVFQLWKKVAGSWLQWIPRDVVLIWTVMHGWKTSSMVVGTGWGIRDRTSVLQLTLSDTTMSKHKPKQTHMLRIFQWNHMQCSNHDQFSIKILFMLEKLQVSLIKNLRVSHSYRLFTFLIGSLTGGGLVTWMCKISNSIIHSPPYYLKRNFSCY